MSDLLSWNDFLVEIKDILVLSEQLHDEWRLICHSNDEGHTYLSKKIKQSVTVKQTHDCKVPVTEDNSRTLLHFEYHLMYHISYRVPFLCFNAYKSDGCLVKLEEAWQFFDKTFTNGDETPTMTTILTEMDHPILFKPFLTLHPCRTAELLQSLPESKNKVMSFLSAIGPAIHLKMHLKYEQKRLKLSE